MYYVGLDVHLRHTSICILDENGAKVKQQKLRGSWDLIAQELKSLKGSVAVCYEASCGYGYLYDLFHEVASRVVVAHPGQLRLIFRSKRKNDRADAEKLAKLLFLNEVPTVYVPSANVRAWRQLIEYRTRLVAKRTRAKIRYGVCCGVWGFRHPQLSVSGRNEEFVGWKGWTFPTSSIACGVIC